MQSPPDAGRQLHRPSHLRLVILVVPVVFLLLMVAGSASAQDPSPSPVASQPAPVSSLFPGPPTPEPSLIPGPPVPTPIAHPDDGKSNTCFDCHVSLNDKQQAISETWQKSIHGAGGIGCADCHGGDPRSDQITVAMSTEAGFQGTPSRDATVGICGSCHSDAEMMRPYSLPTDQFSKYWTSIHGQRLLAADDTKVAICIDCHGSHEIKKASDPTAEVYPLNVPATCSRCHSDTTLMEPYGIPTDQYATYEKSVHGEALIIDKDVRAPSCASCHGSHSAKPPQSSEVVDVCGKCHTATQELYLESRHAELETAAPKCWTCHGTHDVAPPSEKLFFHETPPDYECTTCHQPPDMTLSLNVEQFANEEDRRCDTCHHPESVIYSQVEAIAGALGGASDAQAAAEDKIAKARGLGMIVQDAEVALTESKTGYIQGQAAVHTTKLTTVVGHTDEATAKAQSADALAQAKLDESDFRRGAMIIVVALILINVLVLYVIKRRIDRTSQELESEEPPAT
ncbi:MAG: hypothetical protein A2Z32_01600 [Chloroflexi bacterium RBG_16_69_14]|nr:MAG: hypothetical protein A2Z32_01600 [Chloroflexi bacterium RBG_16_69_14]